MLSIDDAWPDDFEDLADRMTAADRAEMAAAGLAVASLTHVRAHALRWHGSLVCLFGVEPAADGTGVPWMLCTDTLAEVPRRAMAAASRDVVQAWRGEFLRLVNLIHRHNIKALRFVRWLGFVIDETPAGPGGEFFTFTWDRPNV